MSEKRAEALRKVDRLLALAKLSAGERDDPTRLNEARSAAWQAVQLIEKHGFQVSDPNAASRARPRAARVDAPARERRRPTDYRTAVEEIFEEVGDWFDPQRKPQSDADFFVNRYRGVVCRQCGKIIEVGERTARYKGAGSFHIPCSKVWTERRKGK